MTIASSATITEPNSASNAGTADSRFRASSTSWLRTAGWISSAKPMPCMVRCSHWSGIRVKLGISARAVRYVAASS